MTGSPTTPTTPAATGSLPRWESVLAVVAHPADASVVAYCRGPYCVLAATAVAQLREYGFIAHRLAAGYPEWVQEGRPVA